MHLTCRFFNCGRTHREPTQTLCEKTNSTHLARIKAVTPLNIQMGEKKPQFVCKNTHEKKSLLFHSLVRSETTREHVEPSEDIPQRGESKHGRAPAPSACCAQHMQCDCGALSCFTCSCEEPGRLPAASLMRCQWSSNSVCVCVCARRGVQMCGHTMAAAAPPTSGRTLWRLVIPTGCSCTPAAAELCACAPPAGGGGR